MSVTFNSSNKFIYTVGEQTRTISRREAKNLIIELAKTGNEQAQAIAEKIGRGPLAARRLRKGLANGTINAEGVANLIKEHLNDFKPRIGSKDKMKVSKSHVHLMSKLQKSYDQSMKFLNDLESYAGSMPDGKWPPLGQSDGKHNKRDHKPSNKSNTFTAPLGFEGLFGEGEPEPLMFNTPKQCVAEIKIRRSNIQSLYTDATHNTDRATLKDFQKRTNEEIGSLKMWLPESVLSDFESQRYSVSKKEKVERPQAS